MRAETGEPGLWRPGIFPDSGEIRQPPANLAGSVRQIGVIRASRRARVAFPIFPSRDGKPLLEYLSHLLVGNEAATERDRLHGKVTVLEQSGGHLDPGMFDEPGGAEAGSLSKYPRKMPETHAGMPCHLFDGDLGIEVFQDPTLNVPDSCRRGHLADETRAALRLTTRALHEDDQLPGKVEGDLSSAVFFDECQRQIHRGTHPRGCPDISGTCEDRIVFDPDLRIFLPHQTGDTPVRRRPFAVEKARLGQEERARAQGRQAFRLAAHRGAPFYDRAVGLYGRLNVVGTDDYGGIWSLLGGKRSGRPKRYSRVGRDVSRRKGDDFDVVALRIAALPQLAVCVGENAYRTHGFKALKARIDDNAHTVRIRQPVCTRLRSAGVAFVAAG